METLKEGKEFLRKNWKDGVECPCCTQYVKLWKYQIHSTMALVLIELYKMKEGEFHHHDDTWRIAKAKYNLKAVHCGDFSKLALWGLIEPMPKDPKVNKKATGYWRITEKGKLFVNNRTKVSKVLFVFNGQIWGEEGEVSIVDSLNKKFDYHELISSHG